MKTLAAMVLMCVVVFLISCGTVDPSQKYPHMVADADPVSAGTIEAQFDRVLSSKVEKAEVEVIFYPRLNAAALEFKYQLVTYRQFWDQAGRQLIDEALERYKTDFTEQNLVNQYRKTKAVYGKVKGRVEWETLKLIGKTRLAYPIIELGYRFKEEMPFFTTLMRSAKEEDSGDDSSRTNSQQINIYFTRAQADELVAIFDHANLMGLLVKKDSPEPEPEDEPPIQAPYREFGGR